jgi:hypothetical protein
MINKEVGLCEKEAFIRYLYFIEFYIARLRKITKTVKTADM